MFNMNLQTSENELICTQCGYTQPIPNHCHKPMKLIDDKLVCWKGEHAPCCNSSSVLDIPEHHDNKMIIKE